MDRIKFSYRKVSVVILLFIIVLPSCTFIKLLTTRIENPTFTYKGFELVDVSESRTNVNFKFLAYNPNEAGIKNVICSYELFVEGKKLLTGIDIPLNLAPKGETEIKVPATIAYKDLVPVLAQVMRMIMTGQKTLSVTIETVFSGKPALYSIGGRENPISFETRLTGTASIPLPVGRK